MTAPNRASTPAPSRGALASRAAAHMLVAAGFVALAAAWSYPLVLRLSTHLPGAGLGDNAVFFWNFWWMRTALAGGHSFFHTPYLFAPGGIDLTLHTHIALPAFVAATALGHLPVLTAANLTTLGALALNGFAAYLLAWRVAEDRGAAIVAGIIFGTSPYIAAHLNGHVNLVNAWPLPLFALACLDAARGRRSAAVLAGVVLGATVYVDYYYAVYELAFGGGALLLACVEFRPCRRSRPPWQTAVLRGLWVAILADAALAVSIRLTGGFTGHAGPLSISVHRLFNPLQVLWLLVALAGWLHVNRRVEVHRRTAGALTGVLGSLVVTLLVSAAVAAPLLWRALQLALRGQYVSQQYYWQNAPAGIDLLTLAIGNPYHGVWGGLVRQLYSSLGIDPIESGAWLGIVPIVLAVYALKRAAWATLRTWALLGAGFFVWSLGSHAHAAGVNTALVMPGALIRYVPLVANARMPGRAVVMVYLALAVLAAIGIKGAPWRRRAVLTGGIALLALADFAATPFPMTPIACPPIYQVVRQRPEQGALAELPLGVGDGFGDRTPADRAMFICQATHLRPLVGGVVARLTPEALDACRRDPLVASWLRLSGMAGLEEVALPLAADARALMEADRISFVMLDRRRASDALREYVEGQLPLQVVAQDGERTLYVVKPAGAQ